MNRFLRLISLLVFLPEFIFASNTLTINSSEIFDYPAGKLKLSKLKSYPELQNSKDVIAFEVKRNIFENIITNKPENLTINEFPITATQNANIELQIERINYTRNTKLFVYNNNKKQQIEAPKSIMYSGKIKGEENSFVSLVYTNGSLFGYVKHNDGSLVSIGPSNNTDASLHLLTPHISNNNPTSDEYETYTCFTDDYHGDKNEISDMLKYKNENLQAKSQLLNASLVCEGAYDFYKIMGSDLNKCTAYIYSVIALTSKIYSEYINVQLSVSEVHIRQDAASDPYYNTTSNLSEKLGKMPSVWLTKGPDRAVVVLFADLSNQPPNTVIAGISMGGEPNIGSLCKRDRGYCVLGINGYYKYPTLHYTWDVNVAAHEIGHNFSAPHTHNCYYAPNMIDTCVTKKLPMPVDDACISSGQPIPVTGTIMSYCHVSNSTHSVELIFHPRTIPLMRKAAEDCSCMKNPDYPFLALLAPLGDTKFRYGGNMSIRWASASVPKVDIFLSLDNGKTWDIKLGANINADDSILTVAIPYVKTDSALVKIVDVEYPEIFETSVVPFSIFYQELSFVTPKQGESFNSNENISAFWTQHFNDNIRLEFTSDGGQNWTKFIETTINSYETQQPLGISSNNCKFKITSLVDNSVVESPVFSIGESTAKIISPNGSESWSAKSTQLIKWTANNLNKCYLEYSTDNGKNWKKITFSKIDVVDGQYYWKVPNNLTDSALIRISSVLSNLEPLDESDHVFSITKEDPSDVQELNIENNSISITSISPNPFSQSTTININNSTNLNENCEIIIVDESGKAAFSYGTINVNSNSNIEHTLKTENLVQGNYFMVLKSKSKVIAYPIKIVR